MGNYLIFNERTENEFIVGANDIYEIKSIFKAPEVPETRIVNIKYSSGTLELTGDTDDNGLILYKLILDALSSKPGIGAVPVITDFTVNH